MAVIAVPAAGSAAAIGAGSAKTGATIATNAALIGGAALSAGGALFSAQATAAAGDFEADVLEQQAAREQEQARLDADEFRRDQRRLIARQIALTGGSGVSLEGSRSLLIEDTAAEGEFQAQKIERGGDIVAERQRQQAELSRVGASNTRTFGTLRAGSLLLGGPTRAFA